MYSYKILSNKENSDKIFKEGINSEGLTSACATVRDVLKTINKPSCSTFIRLSNDFISLVESSNLTTSSDEFSRDSIAVILGYDKTNVKVKVKYYTYHSIGDILKVPIYGMEQLVLDCTSDESISLLERQELVNRKDVVTVNKEDGILVYNHVNADKIKAVLSGIEIDLLYALLREYGVTDNNVSGYLDFVLPNVVKSNARYKLSKSEKVLFDAMFIQNKPLFVILNEIIEQNGISASLLKNDNPDNDFDYTVLNNESTIDVLNILAYLKNKKRIILNKVFNKTGFTVGRVAIAEDVVKVLRFGNVEHKDNVKLNYNGTELVIPSQEYNDTILVGNSDELGINQEYLNVAYEEELKSKKLNKTPKK